jgi:predicted anti-sigma-YlaC factor YlaD
MPTDCSRAREYVSVQLDGELAELELDRLEAHLRICPECSAWAEQVRDVTRRLREASLEVPAMSAERYVLQRHRRSWRVGSAVALASAAAVVATIFVAPSGNRGSLTPRTPPVSFSASAEVQQVPRLSRLIDGRYTPVSDATASRVSFRPV